MQEQERLKKEKEIENMIDGDVVMLDGNVSLVALASMHECDVAWAATYMCDGSESSRDWSERLIEKGINDVAWAAALMCKYFGSSREWAEKQIERGIGNVVLAAALMRADCGSSHEWAEKIKQEAEE